MDEIVQKKEQGGQREAGRNGTGTKTWRILTLNRDKNRENKAEENQKHRKDRVTMSNAGKMSVRTETSYLWPYAHLFISRFMDSHDPNLLSSKSIFVLLLMMHQAQEKGKELLFQTYCLSPPAIFRYPHSIFTGRSRNITGFKPGLNFSSATDSLVVWNQVWQRHTTTY